MIKIDRAVEQEKKDLQADLAKQQQQQQTIKEDPIADIQRSLGNGGFGEYLSSNVEISSPTDASEIEADNIAKEVVSNLTTSSSMNTSLGDDVPPSGAGDGISSSGGGDGISRKLSDSLSSSQDGGMIYRSITDKIRDANTVGGIQRSIAHEVGYSADDDTIYRSISVGNVHASGLGHDVVQRKLSGSISSYSNGMGIQRSVKDKIHRHASGSASASNSGGSLSAALGSSSATKMSAPVQRKMEEGFGTSFAGVRIHTDPAANTISRSINADAFTQGSDVYFRSGAYNPDSTSGQTLLAHELTHVVQNGHGIQRKITSFAKQSIPKPKAAFQEVKLDDDQKADMQEKIVAFYGKFTNEDDGSIRKQIQAERARLSTECEKLLSLPQRMCVSNVPNVPNVPLEFKDDKALQKEYLAILDDAVALIKAIEDCQKEIDDSRFDFAKVLPDTDKYDPARLREKKETREEDIMEDVTDDSGQVTGQRKVGTRQVETGHKISPQDQARAAWDSLAGNADGDLLQRVKTNYVAARDAIDGELTKVGTAFLEMANFKNTNQLQAADQHNEQEVRTRANEIIDAIRERQKAIKDSLNDMETDADKEAGQNANADADDRFKLMNQPIFKAYINAIPKIREAFSKKNGKDDKRESTVREFFGKNAGAITKKAVATSASFSIDGAGLKVAPKGFYDNVDKYKEDHKSVQQIIKEDENKDYDPTKYTKDDLSERLHAQELYDLGLQGEIDKANKKEANINNFMMDSVLTINSGAAAVEQILDQKDNAKERKDKIKELNEGKTQDLLHDSRSKGGLAATKSLAGILGTADSALTAATSGINAFADATQLQGSIKAMKGAAGAIGAAKGIFDMAADSAESAKNRKKNEKAEKEMQRLLKRVYNREEKNLTGVPRDIVRGITGNKKYPGFEKIATSTKQQQSVKDNEFLKRYLESILKIRNNGLRKISIDEIRTVLLLNQSREKSQIEADKKKWAAVTNAGMSISKALKSASGFLGGNLGTSLGIAGAWVSAIFGAIGRRKQAKLAQKEAKKVPGQATIGIVNRIVALKEFPDWYLGRTENSIEARFTAHHTAHHADPHSEDALDERQTINRYCQVYTMLEAANVDMVDFCYAAKKMEDAKESVQIDPDDDWGSDGFEENELKQEKIAFLNLIETGSQTV